jgi:cob(I)alamin adenosyltransferase
MVYLSRIYTKSGDGGETGLGDGSRVAKDHARVAAYGSVDELNSVLGVLLASVTDLDGAIAHGIRLVQNDLFDVGADLCRPIDADDKALRVLPEQTAVLEKHIDRDNETLAPLTSFILPGGKQAAAWCHLARTVCRRAERETVTLSREERINPEVVIYLNRLSDWLFVLARVFNGGDDVLWVPGGKREEAQG